MLVAAVRLLWLLLLYPWSSPPTERRPPSAVLRKRAPALFVHRGLTSSAYSPERCPGLDASHLGRIFSLYGNLRGANTDIHSIGIGKIVVELFSLAISVKVCKYRSCTVTGCGSMSTAASTSLRAACSSPSA